MTSFIQTLLDSTRPLIMEVKRNDGHGNDLLGGRSVREVVEGFEAAGAPCVSVVTGRWFGGTDAMLREVAELTDRPILQKDFIHRKDQLVKAKALGASAVLITIAVLPKSTIRHLVEACLNLGLTPFVEVTTGPEIARVPFPEECAIAVNNKDILTKERGAGDLNRSLRLLPALLRSGTRCPVSASGIDHPEIAAGLLEAGYAGLLIGTGVLRSNNLGAWLAALEGVARPAGEERSA